MMDFNIILQSHLSFLNHIHLAIQCLQEKRQVKSKMIGYAVFCFLLYFPPSKVSYDKNTLCISYLTRVVLNRGKA